jgi:hypothetical protein
MEYICIEERCGDLFSFESISDDTEEDPENSRSSLFPEQYFMWAPHEYDNFGGSRAVFPT